MHEVTHRAYYCTCCSAALQIVSCPTMRVWSKLLQAVSYKSNLMHFMQTRCFAPTRRVFAPGKDNHCPGLSPAWPCGRWQRESATELRPVSSSFLPAPGVRGQGDASAACRLPMVARRGVYVASPPKRTPDGFAEGRPSDAIMQGSASGRRGHLVLRGR